MEFLFWIQNKNHWKFMATTCKLADSTDVSVNLHNERLGLSLTSYTQLHCIPGGSVGLVLIVSLDDPFWFLCFTVSVSMGRYILCNKWVKGSYWLKIALKIVLTSNVFAWACSCLDLSLKIHQYREDKKTVLCLVFLVVLKSRFQLFLSKLECRAFDIDFGAIQ